jgi:hypothetical protein
VDWIDLAQDRDKWRALRWDIPVVCLNIKHDVGDSQNTTKYLFSTAAVQDSNNYMFRPVLVHTLEIRNIQPDDGQ